MVGRVVLCNWSPAWTVKYWQSTLRATLSLTLTRCKSMQGGLGFQGDSRSFHTGCKAMMMMVLFLIGTGDRHNCWAHWLDLFNSQRIIAFDLNAHFKTLMSELVLLALNGLGQNVPVIGQRSRIEYSTGLLSFLHVNNTLINTFNAINQQYRNTIQKHCGRPQVVVEPTCLKKYNKISSTKFADKFINC